MNAKSYLKLVATAAVLAAAPAAAKGDVKGAESGVRSAQSLPAGPVSQAKRSPGAGPSLMASANAQTFPTYCRGEKVGIHAGKGQKSGNGKALSCPSSPG
jgi:hypothetical protein